MGHTLAVKPSMTQTAGFGLAGQHTIHNQKLEEVKALMLKAPGATYLGTLSKEDQRKLYEKKRRSSSLSMEQFHNSS